MKSNVCWQILYPVTRLLVSKFLNLPPNRHKLAPQRQSGMFRFTVVHVHKQTSRSRSKRTRLRLKMRMFSEREEGTRQCSRVWTFSVLHRPVLRRTTRYWTSVRGSPRTAAPWGWVCPARRSAWPCCSPWRVSASACCRSGSSGSATSRSASSAPPGPGTSSDRITKTSGNSRKPLETQTHLRVSAREVQYYRPIIALIMFIGKYGYREKSNKNMIFNFFFMNLVVMAKDEFL